MYRGLILILCNLFMQRPNADYLFGFFFNLKSHYLLSYSIRHVWTPNDKLYSTYIKQMYRRTRSVARHANVFIFNLMCLIDDRVCVSVSRATPIGSATLLNVYAAVPGILTRRSNYAVPDDDVS